MNLILAGFADGAIIRPLLCDDYQVLLCCLDGLMCNKSVMRTLTNRFCLYIVCVHVFVCTF